MKTDATYLDILAELVAKGTPVTTRNSLCRRLVCVPVCFDSTPLVGVRKTAWKNCLREWQWFMSGSSNIRDLHDSVKPWWQPWANALGYIWGNYSEQFRYFRGKTGRAFDQIGFLIDAIRNHPNSRRNVITTWNTADMAHKDCPLTNCHGTVIQAFVEPDNKLHLVTYQRSCDYVCGVPHNWLQYWAFMLWLAHRSGRQPGMLSWIGGDVHLYEAHEPLAKRMLEAGPAEVPELVYTPTSDAFLADDFALSGNYEPKILERAEMVV